MKPIRPKQWKKINPDFMKNKKEKDIESFKEKALQEEVFINLQDVSDKLFIDSEHMNEFWRICIELYQKQNEISEVGVEKMEALLQQAYQFAKKAHEGQMRKTTGEPYITHPVRVANILSDAGMPIHVVIAGFNHDTVEDTNVTIEDLVKEFGEEVAQLIAFNTEEKDKSWEERKTHTHEQLKTGTLHQKALVVADKMANLEDLIKTYQEIGEDVWKSFKRGRKEQCWYFSGVLINAKENLSPEEIPDFFFQYEKMLHAFFNEESSGKNEGIEE